MFPGLTLKYKLGLGIVLSYTSYEVYMQIRTQYIIRARQQEFRKLENGSSDVDISKFKSAVVGGMFVNPFEEYRPQTAFEFIVVRIMQLFESLYGNKIELHTKLPNPHDGAVEVEDILKVFKPDIERFRANSKLLQSCIEVNDFLKLLVKPTWFNSIPLRQQLLFTWLGQSCTLFQILGVNFLTDPILSEHLISPHVGRKD